MPVRAMPIQAPKVEALRRSLIKTLLAASLVAAGALAPDGPAGAVDPLPDPAADPIVNGPRATERPAHAADAPHPGRVGALTADETAMARIAWRYFENNTSPETGLANAADRYPSTSLWDIASHLAAILAAERLDLIPATEAEARTARIVETLERLPLFRDECPNKAYNTITSLPVTYRNEPGEIGCSALDVGRLLIWLTIVKDHHPHLAPAVDRAVARWNLDRMVLDGRLYGAGIGPDGETVRLQEGRLGYEEYAAKGFRLWGYDTAAAAAPEPYDTLRLYGVTIPYDARDPRVYGAHTSVVTESYALDGIEFGWDDPLDRTSDPFVHTDGWIAATARNIYAAQERRFERTGILTARTEHQLAGDPYFVYDTLYANGRPWATITDTGTPVPEAAAVATKGALGLWVLFDTDYTDRLFAAVKDVNDPERGHYEGILESGAVIEEFTANNNGIILETLLYKTSGPLIGLAR